MCGFYSNPERAGASHQHHIRSSQEATGTRFGAALDQSVFTLLFPCVSLPHTGSTYRPPNLDGAERPEYITRQLHSTQQQAVLRWRRMLRRRFGAAFGEQCVSQQGGAGEVHWRSPPTSWTTFAFLLLFFSAMF